MATSYAWNYGGAMFEAVEGVAHPENPWIAAANAELLLVPKRLGEAVAARRATDAELVRAAGCACAELREASLADPHGSRFAGRYADESYQRPAVLGIEVIIHDPRCPIALALKIEGR